MTLKIAILTACCLASATCLRVGAPCATTSVVSRRAALVGSASRAAAAAASLAAVAGLAAVPERAAAAPGLATPAARSGSVAFGIGDILSDTIPSTAGRELLGDWTIETGADKGQVRKVRSLTNSRTASVAWSGPEAVVFRKALLGCCGFGGVDAPTLTIDFSRDRGADAAETVGVFDATR